MKFKEKDVCRVKNLTSPISAKFYDGIKHKYPTITCPCHIPTTEHLVIVGYVLKKYAVVTLEDNPSVVSVFYEDDLININD